MLGFWPQATQSLTLYQPDDKVVNDAAPAPAWWVGLFHIVMAVMKTQSSQAAHSLSLRTAVQLMHCFADGHNSSPVSGKYKMLCCSALQADDAQVVCLLGTQLDSVKAHCQAVKDDQLAAGHLAHP